MRIIICLFLIVTCACHSIKYDYYPISKRPRFSGVYIDNRQVNEFYVSELYKLAPRDTIRRFIANNLQENSQITEYNDSLKIELKEAGKQIKSFNGNSIESCKLELSILPESLIMPDSIDITMTRDGIRADASWRYLLSENGKIYILENCNETYFKPQGYVIKAYYHIKGKVHTTQVLKFIL